MFLAAEIPACKNALAASERLVDRPRAQDSALVVGFVIIGFVLPAILPRITDSASIQDILWGLADLVALAGLIAERKAALALMRASSPLLLLLVLAGLSALWSDDPGASARRAFGLCGSGLLSLWIVCRVGFRGFLDAFVIAIAILAAISVVLILFVPGIGIMPDGEWQGCFDRKNTLGQVMMLGIVTVYCAMDGSSGKRRALQFSALLFFGLLLLGARSGTSTLVLTALAVALPIMYWSRAKLSGEPKKLTALVLCAAVFIGVTSTAGKSLVLGALGKDETLTTRTDVWQYALNGINERPLLGHGYKVFWLTHGGIGNDTGRDAVTWATQAHNGYLEVALDLGLVGVCVLLLFLAIATQRALRSFWLSHDVIEAWPLLVLTAFILTSFTEATMLKYNDIEWVVFVSAFLFATGASRQISPRPVARRLKDFHWRFND